VLAACDAGQKTKAVAVRFGVSPAWVRRLKQHRRERDGDIAPRTGGGSRGRKIDRDRLAALVQHALGPLLAWEAAHPSDLVRTLEVHLRNGCSPTRTAALLHIGRQSLYQRLERIESLLGLEIDDPDLLGELLTATCAQRVVRTTKAVARGGLRTVA
jgi:DNA-binding PucR family transcriptional regulator